MTNNKKTEGKTSTVCDGVTETQRNKDDELVFVDGKPTKESMLKVIPSLLKELDQSELNDIYGTVWHLTSWKMLYKMSKKEK
jgi:hypothetical protein